jgi:hypothetical protein
VCRVDLVTIFFSRLVNREQDLKLLLRQLDRETMVLTCQRLGYLNIFDPRSPALSYRLRMWRADERNVAHSLFKISLTSAHESFTFFALDGEEKKVCQGPGVLTSEGPLICYDEGISPPRRSSAEHGI